LLLSLAPDASAQYFGRNKVQYDADRVLVLATDHFDIYYSQEDAAAAALAARMAERWYARLSVVLRHTLRGRQPIVLYGSHRRFEQTNIHDGLIGESTGGFTDSRKRRIVLPFAASLADTDHVLGHELVHAFQFDIADQYHSPLGVPLWFVEGIAEYLTLGPGDPQTAMWMRDAVQAGTLPSIKELASARYFPYRWGAALWAHLVARFGDDLPARALRARRDVKRRLLEVTGQSLETLTAGWHEALRNQHATAPAPAAAALISNRHGGGRLNLAASLSPDGRRMVFLSERDQFSMDLYLADAQDGRVIRKLLTTATSAEFESLQYLHSAGAWDWSGTRYALGTITRGRATLVIIDVDHPANRRELVLTGVDEIYSPTWSPDGTRIAFSALAGGVSDLSAVTVATGAVQRLTADPYADLQPAWSPDGRVIAFTTDRFTTDLSSLGYGAYRIGLLDPVSGAIVPAPAVAGINHLDPEWGGDGMLFFVGDPGGVPNVFRLDPASAAVVQVTSITTGVAGVTPGSPALSVSRDTGAIAFSVFRNGAFEVHRVDAPAPIERAARLEAVTARPVEPRDLPIPPVPPLPALAASHARSSYRPRLSLEGIGSPYFSAGGGPLGSYVSGGASLLFGDLLGDHQLLTAAHISSRLDESALGAMYVNRRSRWNWGVSIEQTPDMRVRTTGVEIDPAREHALTRTRERMLWTTRRIGGFAAYPISRSRRVEIHAGVRELGFSRDLRTESVSTRSGMVFEAETRPLEGAPSIGIGDTGLALVGDTTIFGATAPLLGSRYRLQATANTGALSYTNVIADYRRYVMPVRPYTLALRVVHSGRYGSDAGDFRLRDAYVGAATLVRGYGPREVLESECPTGSADCPALNRLLANRVVAAKLEVRVPLWSLVAGSSRVRYGPLPVDVFGFADAGTGWGGEARFGPHDSGGRFVRSLGAGLRANVIGLILEATATRPFDLRRQGWSFGVDLRPGF
jgi:Tol biopolymer transport system component